MLTSVNCLLIYLFCLLSIKKEHACLPNISLCNWLIISDFAILDYNELECDIEENSILTFAPQKNSTPMLPVLDTNSSISQPDINLVFEPTQKESSSAEDLHTLPANGLDTVMSNGIQIAPCVNYGEKKCTSIETDGDMKTFLSKPKSVERPMINM